MPDKSRRHEIRQDSTVLRDHTVGRNQTVGGDSAIAGNQTVGGTLGVTGEFDPAGGLTPNASHSGGAITAETDVEVSADVSRLSRRTRLVITDLVISITDANDFGSAAIATLPDSNVRIDAVEADLTIEKDGTGFVAGTDLDVSIGTAAATATDLTATPAENDLIESTDLNDDALTVDFEAHSFDNTTPGSVYVADADDNQLFINVAGPTETSEDGSATVNGFVDVYWTDLGNALGA